MENRRIDDEKFMRQALNEARRAFEQEEVPIGAVIVAGDRVIGRGHNLVETLRDATAHAEMQALTAAASTLGGKYLQECTLYVTVEPCVMCAGAIAWSQIGLSPLLGADFPAEGTAPERSSESGVRGADGTIFRETAAVGFLKMIFNGYICAKLTGGGVFGSRTNRTKTTK